MATPRSQVKLAFDKVVLVRYFLAGVFAVAAIAKLRDFVQFERTLAASRLVPSNLFYITATAIIALELLVVLGLALPIMQPILQRMSLNMAALLSSIFLSYSAWRWIENIQVPCHCFGILFRLDPPGAILLNTLLLTLIVYILIGKHSAEHSKFAFFQRR